MFMSTVGYVQIFRVDDGAKISPAIWNEPKRRSSFGCMAHLVFIH